MSREKSTILVKNLYPEEIGARLLACRDALGLSQEEVAQLIGYKSANAVKNYEKGQIPRVPELIKLCEIYGKSLSEILYGSEDRELVHQSAPEPALQLWDVFVGLESRDQRLIRVEMGLLLEGSKEAKDAIRSSMKLIFQAFKGEIAALPS